MIDIIPVNNCPEISLSTVPADKDYLEEYDEVIAMGICIILLHAIEINFFYSLRYI